MAELVTALEAFPLERWLRDAGFEAAGHDEWVARCPRCGKDRKLSVELRKRRWKCWVCQRREVRQVRDPLTGASLPRMVTVEGGGGLLALLAWWYGVRRGEAAGWVLRVSKPVPAAMAQIPDLERAASAAGELDTTDLDPPDPPEGAGPLTGHNLRYLESRGISEGVARAYGIFGCHAGRYAGRIVFPAWGRSGELRYWQARATWSAAEDEARGRRHIKAINPPRSDADPRLTSEHAVFNLHRAAAVGSGRVVLCEGPISAIQAGDDAVALWGKQLYPAQVRELVSAGVRDVDVMFDGPTEREPEGAWPEAVALVPLLQLFFNHVRLVRLPAGDPGDYTRAQNAAFRAYAAQQPRSDITRIA